MINPTYRPPGLYEEQSEQTYTPLALREQGIVGFMGLSQRGPLNIPVRLEDFSKFKEIFGILDEPTYLEDSVKSFFENGGEQCYVLRVAHLDPRSPGELATLATARFNDANKKPTILIDAKNEGDWGNSIRVEAFAPQQQPQTFLTLDMKKGQNEATVKSTHGIDRGSLLRIYDDDGNEEVLEVAEIEGRVVRFMSDTPASFDHASSAPTYLEPVLFGIRAEYLGQVENFDNLSFGPRASNYFEQVINANSEFISTRNLQSSSSSPQNLPAFGEQAILNGGRDGFHGVVPGDFIGMVSEPGARFGLKAFEILEDVDILCIPDLMWAHKNSTGFNSLKDIEVVQQAMITQCEEQRDRFCILDLPNGTSPDAALQWRQLFDSPYGAFYFPWIKANNTSTDELMPPSGFIAGVFARCDTTFGLHKAPANEEIVGALDVGIELTDGDIGTLNHHGINCIKAFPARGIRVWGARTISSDAMQRHIPVRRVMSGVIRAMTTDLQWVVFEPNTPNLWKKVLRNVSIFLYNMWTNGYFKGERPEDAFFVQCDENNNPTDVRERGMVIVDVGIAPVRPAEFVMFRVVQENELNTGE
jgi:hypothetical protein